jgi:transcriptional regulator with XRE-family HTH domain
MELTQQLSDRAVLSHLGRRLAQFRLDRNVTQRELAAEAGVSLPTVQRLEGGRGATLTALVRVLRALDLLEGLEALVPEPLPSPIEQLERGGRLRQRAAGAHSKLRRQQSDGWSWATTTTSRTSPSLAATGRVSPPRPESMGAPRVRLPRRTA